MLNHEPNAIVDGGAVMLQLLTAQETFDRKALVSVSTADIANLQASADCIVAPRSSAELDYRRPEVDCPSSATIDVQQSSKVGGGNDGRSSRLSSSLSAENMTTETKVTTGASRVMLDEEGDLESQRCSRRNKRKMTEPRRRATTDFSIRSICSSSNSDVDVGKDDDDDNDRQTPTNSKRWRPDLDSNRSDDTYPFLSGGITSQGSNTNIASAGTFAAAAAAAAAFELPKPFLYYPLNIPMIYYASSGFTSGGLNPFASAISAASSVVVGNAFSASVTAETAASASSAVRRQSPSTDGDNIPSPTKDDEQRPLICREIVDDDDRRPVPPLGVDIRSRSTRRQGGNGNRRMASTAAAAGSSSASPDDNTDGSPVVGVDRRVVIDTGCSRRGSLSMIPAVSDAIGQSRASSPLRKNYKNMTKQRRIEANARERTRVHTISAAFESLRRAVPSYSYNQRLSKLAILRIACRYILALARLADLDYGVTGQNKGEPEGEESLTFAECVDLCTQTIQTEGKAKRRH